MSRFRLILTLICAVVFALPGQSDIVGDFSRLEDTWAARISPDGNTLAIGCIFQNKRSVCISPIGGTLEPTVYPSPDNASIIDFYWANDKHVIIVTDTASMEELSDGVRMVRFNRAISFNAETGKSALLLTDYMNFSNTSSVDSLNASAPDKVIMSLLQANDRRGRSLSERSGPGLILSSFDVDLDSGRARQRRGSRKAVVAMLYDENGDVAVRTIFDPDAREFELRNDDNRLIYEDNQRSVQPLRVMSFTEDGKDLLVWADGMSVSGYERGVWRMSMETGLMERIERDGFSVLGHSPVIDRHTNRAVGYRWSDDLSGQFLVDDELASHQEMITEALGGSRVRLASWSRDRRSIVVEAERIGRPVEYYLFEPESLNLSLIGALNEVTAARPLGEVIPVKYPAADGMEIPGYLTLPEGKSREEGPFPIILLPHGGPDASDTGSYDYWSQAYAAAGYAVLQPNFRGSNRYGAAHREAGFGEFGGKMVTDVTDGLAWLEAEGIAQPGGACVVGASYGGYSALMAPLLRPDVVKCAISVNGVTDPIAQMGQHRTTNREVVSYWEQYMGSTFSSKSEHARITPTERVGEYRSPVLLIHGDQDTRVQFGQFSAFRKAARGASWLSTSVMEGADHFLGTQSARQQVLAESLAFLATHHPVN